MREHLQSVRYDQWTWRNARWRSWRRRVATCSRVGVRRMGFSTQDHLWLSLFSCTNCLFLCWAVDRSLCEWVCVCVTYTPDNDLYFSLNYSNFSENSQASKIGTKMNQSQLCEMCSPVQVKWIMTVYFKELDCVPKGAGKTDIHRTGWQPESPGKRWSCRVDSEFFLLSENSGFATKVLANWMGLTHIMGWNFKLTCSPLTLDINQICRTTHMATPPLVFD